MDTTVMDEFARKLRMTRDVLRAASQVELNLSDEAKAKLALVVAGLQKELRNLTDDPNVDWGGKELEAAASLADVTLLLGKVLLGDDEAES